MKYFVILLCFVSIISCADDKNCISVKKNFSDYKNEEVYDLDFYITDCKGKSKKVDTFGYFGDVPKINFYFFENIGSINRLFVSTYVYTNIYEENPKYIYQNGKYNFIYVYDCNGLNCKKNEKISNFFGNGGNLVNVNGYKVVSNYPYDSIVKIKEEVNSNLFKKWFANQLKKGHVLNKTNIYQENGVNSKKLGYLIQGDEFFIKDISLRWFNIIYKRKNGEKIEGWIDCRDTDLCL